MEAGGGGAPAEGSLLAMIVDEDTATGLLLTGVGHVDARRRANFLAVDDSERALLLLPLLPLLLNLQYHRLRLQHHCLRRTVTTAHPPRPPHAPLPETTQAAIEDAFREFTTREDVAVLLITQAVAGGIRHLIDAHAAPIPAILEIPSKDAPYDPSQDSILRRVKLMFGEG